MTSPDDTSFVRPLLGVLRSRKWIVFAAVVAVVSFAAALSATQSERFEASSQVLIGRSNLANVLNGTEDPAEFDFNRVVQTQANLTRTRAVAERTLQAAGMPGRTPEDFLRQSSVETSPTTDLITLRVRDGEEDRAVVLARKYAEQFVAYREAQTVGRLRRVQRDLEAESERLEDGSSAATANRGQLTRIRSLIALGDSSISAVQADRSADQVQPKTARNVVLALVLGLVVGVLLAFLVHRLDTKLRTSAEVESSLGLPLLGRIPAPVRRLRKADGLATLDEPDGVGSEAFRVLRTNMLFVDMDRQAEAIMLTSAVQSEGKSTTAANLAVTLARNGQHVVLADFDFRRPYIERFFELDREPGATAVVLGQAELDDALTTIPLQRQSTEGERAEAAVANGRGALGDPALLGHGCLEVLPTGRLPPSVGEFITSEALLALLGRLRARCDVLLIDGPPLLQVGDTMAMTAHIDALVVVARLGVVRRPMLEEVSRALATSPATVLGVVVTDAAVERKSGYYGGYAYGYGYGRGAYAEARSRRRDRARTPPSAGTF